MPWLHRPAWPVPADGLQPPDGLPPDGPPPASSLLRRHADRSGRIGEGRPGPSAHTSATMTLDVYSHLWPDDDDSTRAALDAVLVQGHVSSSCREEGDALQRPRPEGVVTASRPVGGILSSSRGSLGGHPSERPTWGTLPLGRRASNPFPTLGLAPGGVYRAGGVTPVAGALLPHPFTLTCADPEARHRRFPFCGTVLRVTPTGR